MPMGLPDLLLSRTPPKESKQVPRRGVGFKTAGKLEIRQIKAISRVAKESRYFSRLLYVGGAPGWSFPVLLVTASADPNDAPGALSELLGQIRLQDPDFPEVSGTTFGYIESVGELQREPIDDIKRNELRNAGFTDSGIDVFEENHIAITSMAEYATAIREALESRETDELVQLVGENSPVLAEETHVKGAHAAQDLGRAALLSLVIDRLRDDLSDSVSDCRLYGASWSEIGKATGMTSQAAWRRWDPTAKEKHAAYKRAQRATE